MLVFFYISGFRGGEWRIKDKAKAGRLNTVKNRLTRTNVGV